LQPGLSPQTGKKVISFRIGERDFLFFFKKKELAETMEVEEAGPIAPDKNLRARNTRLKGLGN